MKKKRKISKEKEEQIIQEVMEMLRQKFEEAGIDLSEMPYEFFNLSEKDVEEIYLESLRKKQ